MDVRKALEMATDRASIAKVIDGQVADSMVAPATNPCPNPTTGDAIPAYDPAGAASLLDKAGWAKGSDGKRGKGGKPLKLTLLAVSTGDPSFDAANELVAKAWRALGIDVKTQILAPNAAIQAFGQGAWDGVPLFSLNVPTPSQLVPFLSGPTPPAGANSAGIQNAEYSRLVAKAPATAGAVASCRVWNQADRALIANADFLPAVSFDTIWFVTKQVGLEIAGGGIVPTSVRMRQG